MRVNYYGIVRDDQYLITSVRADDKDAYERIQRSLTMWMFYYTHSNLKIVKLTRRNENGWEVVK